MDKNQPSTPENLPYEMLEFPACVGYNINDDRWDDVGYILNLIAIEEMRIKTLKERYEAQLLSLPKGTIRTRKRGRNIYYYLSYRDGKRIITDYVGKEEKKLSGLRELLEK